MAIAFGITLLAVISMVLCDVTPPKTKEEIKAIVEKCKQETGFEGMVKNINPDSATKEAKCYLKCLFENKGILKKDGSADLEVAKAYVTASDMDPERKAKYHKALEECYNEVKPITDDLCENAYVFLSCKIKKMNA